MNIETGEIKDFETLTDAERKDPKWMPMKDALLLSIKTKTFLAWPELKKYSLPSDSPRSKREYRNELYMRKVREKEAVR